MSDAAKAIQSIIANAPSSDDFLRALGKATLLMSMARSYRSKDAAWIEAHISTPLALKQMQVISQGKQPVALVTWAWVSEAVKQKIEAGDHLMSLPDWRSGTDLQVVDCISPFTDRTKVIDQFKANMAAAARPVE